MAALLLGLSLSAGSALLLAQTPPAPPPTAAEPPPAGIPTDSEPEGGETSVTLAPPTTTASAARQRTDQGAATESARERGRVLLKRNPIASEYQVLGGLGLSPGAYADAEGVDYRAFFPTRSLLDGPPSLYSAGLSLNFNHLSENAELGGDAAFVVALGGDWRLGGQLRSAAAYRYIQHYQGRWSPFPESVPNPDGRLDALLGQNFLDRLRLSQDTIYTRNSTAGLQLEGQIGPRHRVYVRGTAQYYSDRFYRNRLEYQANLPRDGSDPGVIAFEVDGTTVESLSLENDAVQTRRYFGDTHTIRRRYRLTLGGSRDFADGGGLDYSAYVHRWDITQSRFDWNFNDDLERYSYDASDPAFPVPEATLDGATFDPFDAQTARFGVFRENDTFTDEEDYAGRLDLTRPLDLGYLSGFWNVGGLYRTKERINREQIDVYRPNPAMPFTLADVGVGVSPGRIVDDTYRQPPGLNRFAGREFFRENSETFFALDAPQSIEETAEQPYDAEETVYGTYAALDLAFGDWQVRAGLRGEYTETETSANEVFEADGMLNINPTQASNSYWDLLPSLALEFQPAEGLRVRAAYDQLLMRPQYTDIVEFRTIFLPTQSINEGNPDLQATTISNARLAVLWESDALGKLAAEVYWTEIEDFFYDSSRNLPRDGQIFTVSRVENGPEGEIYGFALEWEKDWLPDSDDLRLSTSAAYTFSESEATVVNGGVERTIWVPERSKHLLGLNATTGWKDWSLSGEVKYQSTALDDVGANAEEDEYRRGFFQTRLSARYRFREHWNASLSVFNLTNQAERSYEGRDDRIINNEYSSWFAVLRVGFRL